MNLVWVSLSFCHVSVAGRFSHRALALFPYRLPAYCYRGLRAAHTPYLCIQKRFPKFTSAGQESAGIMGWTAPDNRMLHTAVTSARAYVPGLMFRRSHANSRNVGGNRRLWMPGGVAWLTAGWVERCRRRTFPCRGFCVIWCLIGGYDYGLRSDCGFDVSRPGDGRSESWRTRDEANSVG